LSATLAAAWQAVQSEHRCAVLDVRLTNQTQLR
jgi:hypothetical protein